jgi:serine/threonine protein kinase
MLIGTPSYAAPEQARGDREPTRASVSTASVRCCFTATGRVPFEGDTIDR